MVKTYREINERINGGEVVVVTAEEMIDIVEEKGVENAAKEVDVVTTGTFGAMCSSGAFLNFGHADPPIRMQKALLNNVPAYAGIAAVDVYIGATSTPEGDETYRYGGGHVIEDLVSGKDIRLKGESNGTDCYPRKTIDTNVSLETINQAYLYNPRNAYQNYVCATNSSDRDLYTYMGKLSPNFGNVNYTTAGQLSPLLNDPFFKTIGVGTSLWLAGARGYVAWEGTQFNAGTPKSDNGIPKRPAGALAVIGNLKEMDPAYLKGLTYPHYGSTLGVGIGIPIPILNEEIAKCTAVKNEDIYTAIFDYSQETRNRTPLKEVSYAQLNSGTIEINGTDVKTKRLADLNRARNIARILKEQVEKGEFTLNEPTRSFPIEKQCKPLEIRE